MKLTLLHFLQAHWKNAKYLFWHKWYVCQACWQIADRFSNPGMRWRLIWLGLAHDLSKLLPDEWFAYARYFWAVAQPTPPDWAVKTHFDRAWLMHQKRNKHHWQYWVLINDTDPTQALVMPDLYLLEMLADWWGAGQAQHAKSIVDWYETNRGKMILHPDTRRDVEFFLYTYFAHFQPWRSPWTKKSTPILS